jgi:hypothetical protein
MAVALSLLLRIAAGTGEEDSRSAYADRLVEVMTQGISSYATKLAESALAIDFAVPAETGG